MNPLPQRPHSHITGDEAVRLFMQACPQEWVIAPVAPDYGLDLRVELVRDGAVTGEEFAVQIKGRKKLRHTRVRVAHPTVNYWLGKLQPTMIVVVDIQQHHLWFGWLDHVYLDYPHRVSSNGDIEFHLTSEVSATFRDDVLRYISGYFDRLRDEATLLGDRLSLSRFLLHASALAQALTRIHLAATCGKPAEQLQDSLHIHLLEYGIHDSFLVSLHAPDSPWSQPLSSRIASIVASKLGEYLRLRSHFWMADHRVDAGDIALVPISYSAMPRYLLPTLEAIWELQDTLARLLTLGSASESPRTT
jgi:hypothetical protein